MQSVPAIPKIIDSTVSGVWELARPALVNQIIRTSKATFTELVRRELRWSSDWPESLLEARTAGAFLHRIRDSWQAHLLSEASHYSRFQWLWYLRRLPTDIFRGMKRASLRTRLRLAESIAEAGGRPDSAELSFPWDANESSIKHVLRFVVGALAMSDIHIELRYAGKGSPFKVGADGIPRHLPGTEHAVATALHDRRNDIDDVWLTGLGTKIDVTEVGIDVIAAAPLDVYSWQVLPVRSMVPGKYQPGAVYSAYGIWLASLKDLIPLSTDPRSKDWWSADILSLLLLSAVGARIYTTQPDLHRTIAQLGYFDVPENDFKFFLSYSFPEALKTVGKLFPVANVCQDATAMIAAVEDIRADLWPAATGAPVVRHGGRICVDLVALTEAIHRRLRYPKLSGGVANARADHFEDVIQGTIDASPWVPSPEIRRLRRRRLLQAGKQLTDIDAIGERGSALLIVSCKSILPEGMYATCDYTAVRNAATTAVSSVHHWQAVRQLLFQMPKGDNYDFSRFSSISAVVCTPFPVYTLPGPATEEIAQGLFACSSAGELRAWLNGAGLATAPAAVNHGVSDDAVARCNQLIDFVASNTKETRFSTFGFL